MKTLPVTGSNGLIGSEMVRYFHKAGWKVPGIDNNMRADFFGPPGVTRWSHARLVQECSKFTHHEIDIRSRPGVVTVVREVAPDAIILTAAQPSHDLAGSQSFLDFDVNAVGTLNLLEAARIAAPAAPFVHLSTNKVYGDAPNRIALKDYESWRLSKSLDQIFREIVDAWMSRAISV